MKKVNFAEALVQILANDKRYDRESYLFVRDALDFTFQRVEALNPDRSEKHVRGKELLDGIRLYALQEYGQMAFSVFDSWGVRRCEDFGEIVFNLVETGVFGKTEEDSREDFKDSYDFHEAFVRPFKPENKPAEKTKIKDTGKNEK